MGSYRTPSCDPCEVRPGGDVQLTATASDPEGDELTYSWSAPQGSFSETDAATTCWTAPSRMGEVPIRVRVSDGSTFTQVSVIVTVSSEGVPALPVAASCDGGPGPRGDGPHPDPGRDRAGSRSVGSR